MFTKRVKSKPANRSRNVSDDDADATGSAATEAATGSDSPSTLATKLKDRAKKSRPKSRLSFGGADEEVCSRSPAQTFTNVSALQEEGSDDVFQVKKSKLSRKLTLGKSKHSQYVQCVPLNSFSRLFYAGTSSRILTRRLFPPTEAQPTTRRI